jgi:hypothetical protein
MLDALVTWTDLTGQEFAILTVIMIVAGIVRGFSGFALSAIVMASAVIVLPPVQLIPICWWLEMTASVLMAKGGWLEADHGVVMVLLIGSTIGVPFGLVLKILVSAETSTLIALALIIKLELTQLAKMRAALALFIFVSSLTSLITLLWFSLMNSTAAARGLSLAVPTNLGVIIGQWLFIPKFAAYYRPLCLSLLCALAGAHPRPFAIRLKGSPCRLISPT